MKITRTNEDAMRICAIREKANEGCRVCPCCNTGFYTSYVYWTKNTLFHTYRADCYRCRECGAEWQSDWYKVG